jgi:hypothetical protein
VTIQESDVDNCVSTSLAALTAFLSTLRSALLEPSSSGFTCLEKKNCRPRMTCGVSLACISRAVMAESRLVSFSLLRLMSCMKAVVRSISRKVFVLD